MATSFFELPLPEKMSLISIFLCSPVLVMEAIYLIRRKPAQPTDDNETQNYEFLVWGTRLAILGGILEFIFIPIFILGQFSSVTGCASSALIAIYGVYIHKFGVYLFAYQRVQIFAQFLPSFPWTQLSYLVKTVVSIFVIGLFFVAYGVPAWVRQENSICRFDSAVPWAQILGTTTTVLMDFTAGGITIYVLFTLFTKNILDVIAETNASAAKLGERIVLWSTIAVVSCVLSMILTTVTQWGLFTNVDTIVNIYAILVMHGNADDFDVLVTATLTATTTERAIPDMGLKVHQSLSVNVDGTLEFEKLEAKEDGVTEA